MASIFVASICLYGTPKSGFATLTQTAAAPAAKDLIGVGWAKVDDRQPSAERPSLETATEAIWKTVSELEARGVRGHVRIFDAGGTRYVDVDTRKHVPAYGRLAWRSVAELPVAVAS